MIAQGFLTSVAVLTADSANLGHMSAVATDGQASFARNPALQLWSHGRKAAPTFGHASGGWQNRPALGQNAVSASTPAVLRMLTSSGSHPAIYRGLPLLQMRAVRLWQAAGTFH